LIAIKAQALHLRQPFLSHGRVAQALANAMRAFKMQNKRKVD
jgi:hypothetical protein